MKLQKGLNKLSFMTTAQTKTEKEVNVVYVVEPPKTRMLVVVIEEGGRYQDLYYNESQGVFKLLSENYEDSTPRDWWNEEAIGVECPDFLNSAGVDNSIFYNIINQRK